MILTWLQSESLGFDLTIAKISVLFWYVTAIYFKWFNKSIKLKTKSKTIRLKTDILKTEGKKKENQPNEV